MQMASVVQHSELADDANVRASFTIKGRDKADLMSRHPDYPSGRCPHAQAN